METTIKLYVDRRRESTAGYPVYLAIKRKERFYIKTGLICMTDLVGREFSKKEPNYRAKNMRLSKILLSVEEFCFSQGDSLSSVELKSAIQGLIAGREYKEKNLTDYIDEFISIKNNPGTIGLYNQTKIKIEKFDPSAKLSTINRKWLSDFEQYMRGEGMSTNGLSIHLRNLRAVFNYCIDEEYTTNYPFRKFQIKKEETRKRCLTVEQLRQLRDYPVEAWQERYRDLFLLMFYLIGINAGDLFELKSLTDGRIVYHRKKTNRLYDIAVPPEAMEIIKKYKGKEYLINPRDDYSNYKDFLHRMNLGLKSIGEHFENGKRKTGKPLFPDISSYWARHTWATIAASLDIPKETIAAALGHSESDTTSIYIKFDNRKIDEANRKVIDFFNSK